MTSGWETHLARNCCRYFSFADEPSGSAVPDVESLTLFFGVLYFLMATQASEQTFFFALIPISVAPFHFSPAHGLSKCGSCG